MPTHERTQRFVRDFERLNEDEAELFLSVVLDEFVPALVAGPPYPGGLRIKGVQATDGVWEMTWEYHNGRATFAFGQQIHAGEVHIIWRRVGGHDIFSDP